MKHIREGFAKASAAAGLVTTLLLGPPSLHADELTDLRASQEILQRRLDQLSQISPGSVGFADGPSSTAGFPRSFLIPETDTSLRIGGYISQVFDYWFS